MCPHCRKPQDNNDACDECLDLRDAVEEKLEVCRTNECGSYRKTNGKDGCTHIDRCCMLVPLLTSDKFTCPEGCHE